MHSWIRDYWSIFALVYISYSLPPPIVTIKKLFSTYFAFYKTYRTYIHRMVRISFGLVCFFSNVRMKASFARFQYDVRSFSILSVNAFSVLIFLRTQHYIIEADRLKIVFACYTTFFQVLVKMAIFSRKWIKHVSMLLLFHNSPLKIYN